MPHQLYVGGMSSGTCMLYFMVTTTAHCVKLCKILRARCRKMCTAQARVLITRGKVRLKHQELR